MATLSLDGLDEEIADRIVSLIMPKIEKRIEKAVTPDHQLTLDELLDKLHCTYTFYSENYRATIPHIGSGRGIRFSEKAVDQWIADNQTTLI